MRFSLHVKEHRQDVQGGTQQEEPWPGSPTGEGAGEARERARCMRIPGLTRKPDRAEGVGCRRSVIVPLSIILRSLNFDPCGHVDGFKLEKGSVNK